MTLVMSTSNQPPKPNQPQKPQQPRQPIQDTRKQDPNRPIQEKSEKQKSRLDDSKHFGNLKTFTGFQAEEKNGDLYLFGEKLILVGIEEVRRENNPKPANKFYALKSKKWILSMKNPNDKTPPIELVKIAEENTPTPHDREMKHYWFYFNNPNNPESDEYFQINRIKYIPH